jgi:hypothetical protein
VITFGVVDIAHSKIVAAKETNLVLGEWRDVCTPASSPFEIQVLLENSLHTLPLPVRDLPTCFENGAPAPPTAPHISSHVWNGWISRSGCSSTTSRTISSGILAGRGPVSLKRCQK